MSTNEDIFAWVRFHLRSVWFSLTVRWNHVLQLCSVVVLSQFIHTNSPWPCLIILVPTKMGIDTEQRTQGLEFSVVWCLRECERAFRMKISYLLFLSTPLRGTMSILLLPWRICRFLATIISSNTASFFWSRFARRSPCSTSSRDLPYLYEFCFVSNNIHYFGIRLISARDFGWTT